MADIENDNFDQMKSLLDDAEIAPSKDFWPEIEQKLNDKPNPKPFLLLGVGLAILILIPLSYMFFSAQDKDKFIVNQHNSVHTQKVSTNYGQQNIIEKNVPQSGTQQYQIKDISNNNVGTTQRLKPSPYAQSNILNAVANPKSESQNQISKVNINENTVLNSVYNPNHISKPQVNSIEINEKELADPNNVDVAAVLSFKKERYTKQVGRKKWPKKQTDSKELMQHGHSLALQYSKIALNADELFRKTAGKQSPLVENNEVYPMMSVLVNQINIKPAKPVLPVSESNNLIAKGRKKTTRKISFQRSIDLISSLNYFYNNTYEPESNMLINNNYEYGIRANYYLTGHWGIGVGLVNSTITYNSVLLQEELQGIKYTNVHEVIINSKSQLEQKDTIIYKNREVYRNRASDVKSINIPVQVLFKFNLTSRLSVENRFGLVAMIADKASKNVIRPLGFSYLHNLNVMYGLTPQCSLFFGPQYSFYMTDLVQNKSGWYPLGFQLGARFNLR
jgi:hypothetical protein